ncbi:MAG: DUF1800 domain-containing protein [Acidobacteria bacterium]|nr:DUF1800 domain-containing protein [Acidobacteriota bacterium]
MRRPGLSKSIAALCCVSVLVAAGAPDPFRQKLDADRRVEHTLNRAAFGARPGDAERVKKMGVDKWIAQQLETAKVEENPVVADRLKALATLNLSIEQIAGQYPLRADKKPKKGDDGKASFRDVLSVEEIRKLRQGPAEEKLAFLEALPKDKRQAVLETLPQQVRRGMMGLGSAELRREIVALGQPVAIVGLDLVEGKLYRALYSNRQLEEVLVDFWFNHFNVYMNKGPERLFLTDYEREAIRPHVLGNFHDMLLATAKHPAMLYYLDNWQSVDPTALEQMAKRRRGGSEMKQLSKRARGLNENYARELMELHTMGVDGGYTQQDVVEVARAFTGWTLRNPRGGAAYYFALMLHDKRAKTVLGQKLAAGRGEEDGLDVLRLLSRHPATAKFISMKLAQRFVADAPPPALVDRMAATFRKTDGNLREVMRTLLTSNEFFSEGAWRAKLKSPLEIVVSAARALDADVTNALPLAKSIEELGQPLYRKEEPTGYYNTAEEWTNTAGLLGRMNFAASLASNQFQGTKVAASHAKMGVALGGPEFQRR